MTITMQAVIEATLRFSNNEIEMRLFPVEVTGETYSDIVDQLTGLATSIEKQEEVYSDVDWSLKDLNHDNVEWSRRIETLHNDNR